VAAESEEIAEAALELIDVEYEEFEPLLDPWQRRSEMRRCSIQVQHYRGLLHPIDAPSNVFVDMKWQKGDVEAGFRAPTSSWKIYLYTSRPSGLHRAARLRGICRDSAGADVWACSRFRSRCANRSRPPLAQPQKVCPSSLLHRRLLRR
jgi:CO/xanthine dehydrogenase Mo-binding subunit